MFLDCKSELFVMLLILLVILLIAQHKIPQIEGQDNNLAKQSRNYCNNKLVSSVSRIIFLYGKKAI